MNTSSPAKSTCSSIDFVKLLLAFILFFAFYLPAHATTCNYTTSWSLNTAPTPEKNFTLSADNQTLTVSAKPSSNPYQININLVIGFTSVSTPANGDSCLFSLIQNNQSFSTLNNTSIAFIRTLAASGSSCSFSYLGRPNIASTYKGGAYLTPIAGGLFTDIYEFSNCTPPATFVQELIMTVAPGAKGNFTLDASKFVRVSAGQRNTDLNGLVSWSTPYAQALMAFSFVGNPTCAVLSPTVTLPTLSPSAIGTSLDRSVDFSLKLNCGQGNVFAYTVTPTWSFTPVSTGSSIIANSGTASGVGVTVTSKNGVTPAMVTNGYNADTATIAANSTATAQTFNYSAAYSKSAATVSPGTVNANAFITLSVQ